MSIVDKTDPDQRVFLEGEIWTMRGRIGSKNVIVQREYGPSRVITYVELTRAFEQDGKPPSETMVHIIDHLPNVTKREYEIAAKRLSIVLGLSAAGNRTRSQVEAAGKIAGVDRSTVYDWLAAFESYGRVTDLIPGKPGPKKGFTRLDPKVENIIRAQMEETSRENVPIQIMDVQKRIEAACRETGVAPPAPNTVRARIRNLGPGKPPIYRGRRNRSASTSDLVPKNFEAEGNAMDSIRFDHMQANVSIVDQAHQRPIGKPWITLAFDANTKAVCGIYVSLDEPDMTSVAMCMINMVLKKDAYLAELDVSGRWPIHGKPKRVYVDDARASQTSALGRACEKHGIALDRAVGRRPHWGSHIERLIHSFNDRALSMPGVFPRNAGHIGNLDCDSPANMTLRAFEVELVKWIVNQYNSDLLCEGSASSNIMQRQSSQGTDRESEVDRAENELDVEFKLDFLPFVERSIGQKGVTIDYDLYWSETLVNRIKDPEKPIAGTARARSRSNKHIFRFDPRNMDVIYLWDPDAGTHYTIPRRDE